MRRRKRGCLDRGEVRLSAPWTEMREATRARLSPVRLPLPVSTSHRRPEAEASGAALGGQRRGHDQRAELRRSGNRGRSGLGREHAKPHRHAHRPEHERSRRHGIHGRQPRSLPRSVSSCLRPRNDVGVGRNGGLQLRSPNRPRVQHHRGDHQARDTASCSSEKARSRDCHCPVRGIPCDGRG